MSFISSLPAIIEPVERGAWLRLIRTKRIGPHSFWSLMDRFGKASDALEALPDLSLRGGAKNPLVAFSADDAEKEYRGLKKLGGVLMTAADQAFPPLLRQIQDPPPVISVLGQVEMLARPTVAIVGARNASTNGARFAGKIAKELGAQDYNLASGLARGIDAAVHAHSLNTGTIAVVAGGLDIVYPREHQDLYEAIAKQGVVVAEMPLGMQPTARHFPNRNRIIAGMSAATVVIEAAKRSGSLITARYAADFSRDVCAVPGNPLDPRAEGTNQLLKDGAALVCDSQDIIDVLSTATVLQEQMEPAAMRYSLTPLADDDVRAARDTLLKSMSPTPCAIDELLRECQLPARLGAAALVELELGGTVERTAGNMICRLL